MVSFEVDTVETDMTEAPEEEEEEEEEGSVRPERVMMFAPRTGPSTTSSMPWLRRCIFACSAHVPYEVVSRWNRRGGKVRRGVK